MPGKRGTVMTTKEKQKGELCSDEVVVSCLWLWLHKCAQVIDIEPHTHIASMSVYCF